MLPIAYYLLKVIICSGILLGYYWLALRNKVFHHYNRFYLLAAVVLSLVLPVIKINFWENSAETKPAVIKVLRVVSDSDVYLDDIIVSSQQQHWDAAQWAAAGYALVAVTILLLLFYTVIVIYRLLKKYPKQKIGNISFVNTDARSTPFSFLNYIFWNRNIDTESATGKQIFKHEVAHVQEKHTHDKLFINLVLAVYWCNPFFWVIRKELNMIHEFIADKKAVEDSDTASFAAMILQAAYPQHRFQLTNNFFYSPIKRRLAMLVKNNNSKVTYLGRILVLPLAVLVFAAFTFKAKQTGEYQNIHPQPSVAMLSDTPKVKNNKLPDIYYNDKKIVKTVILKDGFVEFNLEDGKTMTMDQQVAFKKGLLVPPPPPPGSIKTNENKPLNGMIEALFVIDGEITNKEAAVKISPEKILSMNVLKGNGAIEKYGNRGKEGVIEITTKKSLPETLYVVDGEIKEIAFVNTIIPENIQSINVIKDESAVKKYGEKAKNGVLEVTTQTAPGQLNEVVVIGYPSDKSERYNQPASTPAAIALDKMNILYIGLDNPITVAAPGVAPEDLVLTVTEGTASITGKNGKYNVRVNTPGQITIGVMKRGDNKLISQSSFRAKRIPDPVNGEIPADYDIKINRLPTEQQWQKAAGNRYPDTLTWFDNNKVFTKVDKEAVFAGGAEAWKKYLMKNLDPSIPSKEGWKPGNYTLIVQFVVRTNGTVSDVITTNYAGSRTAQYCINLVQNAGKWKPAMQNGHAVNSYRRQPITFSIN